MEDGTLELDKHEAASDERYRERMQLIEERPGEFSGVLLGGYIDETGQVQRKFHVREMSGREEDILASRGPVAARMNRLVGNCLVHIGDETNQASIHRIVRSLSIGDKELLTIAIRRASFGALWNANINCPHCRKPSHVSINLSAIEREDMPDPAKRNFDHTLETGRVVSWHVMTSADEEWLEEYRDKDESSDNRLTLAMMCRVDKIDGVALDRTSDRGRKAAIRAMKEMKMRERIELRDLFRKNEGFLDTDITFVCPKCNMQSETPMPFGPDFFSLRAK